MGDYAIKAWLGQVRRMEDGSLCGEQLAWMRALGQSREGISGQRAGWVEEHIGAGVSLMCLQIQAGLHTFVQCLKPLPKE